MTKGALGCVGLLRVSLMLRCRLRSAFLLEKRETGCFFVNDGVAWHFQIFLCILSEGVSCSLSL